MKQFKLGDRVKINFKNRKGINIYIFGTIEKDYDKVGDGIFWVMKEPDVVKSVYTDKDDQLKAEELRMEALNDGEVVKIEGQEQRIKVNGIYSDCAIFEKV